MVQDVDLFGENRDSARRITRVTRRGIFDYIHFHVRAWFGRLDEVAFIGRLYDLAELPLTDGRFRDAGRDI